MTDIYFSFDTEDYTNPDAWTAQRDIASLLHDLGVKANFNVVGHLAYEWIRNGRTDVTSELKNHIISSHTMWHSRHPSICEYTDIKDYNEARRRVMIEENQSMGMVKAAIGIDKIKALCPPGNSYSYAAMYAYAEQGMPLFLGSFQNSPDGSVFFICNQIHANYDYALESLFLDKVSGSIFPDGYNVDQFLENISKYRRVFIYAHPTRSVFKQFWDEVNYRGGNRHELYEWEEPSRYTDEEHAKYFTRLEELVRALQSDDRFAIRDLDYFEDEIMKKSNCRVVTKEQLPKILCKLKNNIKYIDDPVNLSVADCFGAAAHFLDSDEPYHPGTVYGFLDFPRGVTEETSLSSDEVRTLVKNIDFSTFLPPCFSINGKEIGPADLLIAMLEVALGKENVTLTPRDQQCDLDEFPNLRDMRLSGTWVYDKNFRDDYISDRLRLQAWTLRKE